MVAMSGTTSEIMSLLAVLAERYGWNGRLGNVITDLVTSKEKADAILADVASAADERMNTQSTQTYH